MSYLRHHIYKEVEREAPLGFIDLWHSQPLPSAFLTTTAVSAARLILFISVIAYAWALPRNFGVANWLIAAQVVFLISLGLLSIQRVQLEGRLRLALLCGVIVIMGGTAHARNHEILAALFATFPVATLLIISFGIRITLSVMTVIHALAATQAWYNGTQSLNTISVYVSISFLWSIMVASFVALLLVRIERDFNLIGRLLDQERSTLRVITNELRVPAVTLSTLAQHTQPSEEDRTNMRDAAEQMILVIDNLRSGSDTDVKRPVRLELFEVNHLARNISNQLSPIMKRMEIELITDVDHSADLVVSADRFRLRAILVNLIRTAATISDGYRIWLNVRVDILEQESANFLFDIESNGHPIAIDQLEREMAANALDDDPRSDFGTTGLWVAKFWAEQLGGELQLFDSPRGGNGFRLAVRLDLAASLGEEISNTGRDPFEYGWEGMSVVLLEHDKQSARNISRELSAHGLTIVDCRYDEECVARITMLQPELVVYTTSDDVNLALTSLSALRATKSQVPVIAIVTNSNAIGELELLEAGADIVLFDPLKPHDLDSALQSLVNIGRLRRKG